MAELQALEVTDVLANPYRSGPTKRRFIISQTLMVRSGNPELIRAASQRVGELVDAGVVLSSRGGPGSGPTFLFTKLDDIKPEMIAEAAASARKSADPFAWSRFEQHHAVGGGIQRTPSLEVGVRGHPTGCPQSEIESA